MVTVSVSVPSRVLMITGCSRRHVIDLRDLQRRRRVIKRYILHTIYYVDMIECNLRFFVLVSLDYMKGNLLCDSKIIRNF